MLMEDKPPVGGPSVPVGAHKVGGASDQGVRDVRRQINGREEMGGVAGIGAYNVGRLQDQTFGDRRNGQPMGGREEMGGVAGIGAYNVGRFQNQTFGGRRNGQPMDEREEGGRLQGFGWDQRGGASGGRHPGEATGIRSGDPEEDHEKPVKVLCPTPGCSFYRIEEFGGYCKNCYTEQRRKSMK